MSYNCLITTLNPKGVSVHTQLLQNHIFREESSRASYACALMISHTESASLSESLVGAYQLIGSCSDSVAFISLSRAWMWNLLLEKKPLIFILLSLVGKVTTTRHAYRSSFIYIIHFLKSLYSWMITRQHDILVIKIDYYFWYMAKLYQFSTGAISKCFFIFYFFIKSTYCTAFCTFKAFVYLITLKLKRK